MLTGCLCSYYSLLTMVQISLYHISCSIRACGYVDEGFAAPIRHKLWGEAPGEPPLVVEPGEGGLWRKGRVSSASFFTGWPIRGGRSGEGQDVESNICCTQPLGDRLALGRAPGLVAGASYPHKRPVIHSYPGVIHSCGAASKSRCDVVQGHIVPRRAALRLSRLLRGRGLRGWQ
jgi:hypothetical protein